MSSGRPQHEFTSLMEDLARMRDVATAARSTEGDPFSKWEANSELIRWIRTNIFPILSSLEAGADLVGYPNGSAKQRLYNSLKELSNADQ